MEPLFSMSRGKSGEAGTGKTDYRNPAFPDSPGLSGNRAKVSSRPWDEAQA
jgi:hypothetical protein